MGKNESERDEIEKMGWKLGMGLAFIEGHGWQYFFAEWELLVVHLGQSASTDCKARETASAQEV